MKRLSILALALLIAPLTRAAEPTLTRRCQLALYRAQDGVIDAGRAGVNFSDRTSSRTIDWTMDDALKADLSAIYAREDLADESKLRLAFERWVKSPPVKNPVSRFFLRGTARDALAQRSVYATGVGGFLTRFVGPHYNPIFNRSSGYSSRATGATPADVVVASHEWTHAAHRNADPLFWITAVKVMALEFTTAVVRTPGTPLMRRNQEVKAIGGQWEFMRMIPLEMRSRLIARANASETGGISPEERTLINAVYGAGLVERFRDLGTRVIDSTAQVAGQEMTAEDAFELTFLNAMAGSAEKKWFKTFKARAANVLGDEDLEFMRAIMTEGRKAQVVRAALLSHGKVDWTEDGDEGWAVAESIFAGKRYHNRFGPMLTKIYRETLENADLPKDEFVRRMSFTHGYTTDNLMHAHYGSRFRSLMLFFSLQAIAIQAYDRAPAYDVAVFIQFIQWLAN